ncbi:hypothetical protein SAMN05216436_12073 [bacterium A37T11]|nr:hypothetical protein SAMN05216436_12073 [bacterium A37T11]
MTSSKEFRLLEELAKKERNRKMTKEEAIQALVDAGIINKNREFMPPYKNLERIVTRK